MLGLDIGSSSIKIAEVDVGRSQSNLVAFGIVPTPPETFVGGEVLNAQALSIAIREVYAKIETKRKNLAAGLSGTSVIIKKISMPKMDHKLIAEQIRWEAEQYIPFDINDVNLGFEVLQKTGAPSESMDVLLVAAVQSHVFKYAEAIQGANLKCSVMDVSGFALANCFRGAYGAFPNQTIAIMNIGSIATNLVVIENTEIVFCRDVPVGGSTYTLDLQKALNVEQTEAEAIKLGFSQNKSTPSEVASVVTTSHELVLEEVKAGLDFFMNTSRAQNIFKMYVTGGGSKIPGLIDRLSTVAPCEKMDPFRNMKISVKGFDPTYIQQIRDFAAVSIGLGMRKDDDA